MTVVQFPGSTPDPIDFFADRSTFVPARLGEAIRVEGHVRVGPSGTLYRYDSGVYLDDGEAYVARRVRELLGDEYRAHRAREVLAWQRTHEKSIGVTPVASYLNVANGVLEWITGHLGEHAPEYLSTIQFPISWNPRASCPQFDAFLAQTFPDDAQEFVHELIGYMLYAGNPMRTAVLLLGLGGNGKSVFLRVLRSLAGAANVAAVPLQALGENRFAAAELFGKTVNIAGDLDARAIKRTDAFKMLTGGDPVFAERKNGQPFTFVSFALPIFSANEAPFSSDQTQAWFDRWIVIPCANQVPPERRDPRLGDKLTTEDELEGVLVRAVAGLQRVMARGHFDIPASIRAANEGYRERLDTVRGFVTECCVVEQRCWTARTRLYVAYKTWCVEGTRHPLSRHSFYDHLRANWPGLITEGKRGVDGWHGVGLLSELSEGS